MPQRVLRVATLAAVIASFGHCFVAEAGIPATQPVRPVITAENAGRVERVFKRRFRGPLPFRTPDVIDAIETVDLDSSRGKLYVYRDQPAWTGGEPRGIYVFDLETCSLSRKIELPRLTGNGPNQTPVVFDVENDWAVLGAAMGVQWKTGAVRRLNVPELKGYSRFDLLVHPLVDDQRILYWDMELDPSGQRAVYLHRKTLQPLNQLRFPEVDRETLDCKGGLGDYVLCWAYTMLQNVPMRLLALRPAGDHLQIATSREVTEGCIPQSSAISISRGLWYVGYEDREQRALVKVFEVPSLRLVRELPRELWTTEWAVAWLPNSDLLVLHRYRFGEKNIVIVDVRTGKVLKTLNPEDGGLYDRGGWGVFVDQHGRYVGAYGSEWLQVFAVTNTTTAPASRP